MGKKRGVDRQDEFGHDKGFHVSYDYPVRYDVSLAVKKITYQVETLTDLKTGKSVRASMDEEGPAGFNVTWHAISTLVKMHVGFAIPINRIAAMIGQPGFSSGKICRLLSFSAAPLVPVYLYMAESLADVSHLSGDDTSTKVLDTNPPDDKESIAAQIDERLGWSAAKARGGGAKQELHVSLLTGRTEDKEPRSTIAFFRTHQGQLGNLLSKILESRSPKSGPLTLQGDLLSANLPSAQMRKDFHLILAGCGAHARRPFWRYKADDEAFTYYMLRGFYMLAAIEKRIRELGRSDNVILYLRNKWSRKIWLALYNRCVAAMTGQPPTLGSFPPGWEGKLNRWPPGTHLYDAARYVVEHYKELTRYLDDPRLEYTNNRQERALRAEVCMLNTSKFRKTRNGRATLDVLRTINATCTLAGVDLGVYLEYVFKHVDEIAEHPDRFTPWAVAQTLARNATEASVQQAG